MSSTNTSSIQHADTQNSLILSKLLKFYEDRDNMEVMIRIVNGESPISLRIIDWFVTNYAKMNDTLYDLPDKHRFRVYNDYKLNLKAYSKRRFDPFCRWKRITVPYSEDKSIITTIGQLNFFKWAIENCILDYIRENFDEIEADMNERGSNASSRNSSLSSVGDDDRTKTRKKREELSVSACKCIKKEQVKIVVHFS
jgi:hypothetical protein